MKDNKPIVKILRVSLGCTIIIQEVSSKCKKFEIVVAKDKVGDMFIRTIYNQGIAYKFKYRGVMYKILEIEKKKQ